MVSAMTVPRSSSSTAVTTIPKTHGQARAAPMPCTARAPISQAIEGAKVQASEAAKKMARPISSTRRRPNMSPRRPPATSAMASARA